MQHLLFCHHLESSEVQDCPISRKREMISSTASGGLKDHQKVANPGGVTESPIQVTQHHHLPAELHQVSVPGSPGDRDDIYPTCSLEHQQILATASTVVVPSYNNINTTTGSWTGASIVVPDGARLLLTLLILLSRLGEMPWFTADQHGSGRRPYSSGRHEDIFGNQKSTYGYSSLKAWKTTTTMDTCYTMLHISMFNSSIQL